MGGVIKYEGECVIIKYQCYHVDKVHQVASFSIDYPIFPNLKSKDLLRLTKGDWREVVEEIGIEELLEKEFTKLSLGQRKLIALACALSRSAEVYVLDEPTANVDVKKRDIIYNFINKKIKNAIISSHELQEIADLAKNVIIMNKGKVIFIGSLFELSKRFEGRYIIRTDRPEEMKERLGGERESSVI